MPYAARFGTQQAMVEAPMDTAFTGVSFSNDIIDYAINYLAFIEVPDVTTINGKVLLTMTNGPEGYIIDTGNGSVTDTIQLSDYDGNVLMARFAPGDSMYSGGNAAVPAGWRTYMTAGDDHEYDTDLGRQVHNFYVFSDQMKQVFLNEVDYLIRGPVKDSTVDSNELLDDPFAVKIYPNPFENKWNVKLTLDKAQTVQLSLYSLNGRMVKSYSTKQFYAGEHEWQLDGQDLPAGIYIYRLMVGDRYVAGKIQKN